MRDTYILETRKWFGGTKYYILFERRHGCFSKGEPKPGQGSRGDLATVQECIERGRTIRSLLLDHTINNLVGIQYAEKCRKYLNVPVEMERIVFWYWGPSGSGKSRKMWEKVRETNQEYYCHPGGRFLDGYDQQEVVVFDDFRMESFSITKLLQICDRYACGVETKGSSQGWNAKMIFFTSLISPEVMFAQMGEPTHQIMRRITFCMGPENGPEVPKGNNEPLDRDIV